MDQYNSLVGLENIYLEDSFVIGIYEHSNSIEFDIEAVLTEEHELYHVPNKDEQYCYRPMKLIFDNFKSIKWVKMTGSHYVDANEEVDFGNIDSFVLDKDVYKLAGDWGELEITGGILKVEIK